MKSYIADTLFSSSSLTQIRTVYIKMISTSPASNTSDKPQLTLLSTHH